MRRDELYANDRVWAMFYRDGKNLGEIAEEFGVSIYDLNPWLISPIVRASLRSSTTSTSTSSREEN